MPMESSWGAICAVAVAQTIATSSVILMFMTRSFRMVTYAWGIDAMTVRRRRGWAQAGTKKGRPYKGAALDSRVSATF